MNHRSQRSRHGRSQSLLEGAGSSNLDDVAVAFAPPQAPPGLARRAGPAAVVLLAACNNTVPFSGTLDTPGPVAVLQEGGPFDGPVAYAADGHGGRVRVLDVQRGTYLAERPYASFVRGSGLGTGEDRLLSAIAPRVTAEGGVELLAIDRRFNHLLHVPHVGGDGAVAAARITSATFEDRDSSGDSPALAGLSATVGRAGSETWTLTWDGDHWDVSGTRSGVGHDPALPGRPWSSREGGLHFTAGGTATDGDRFTIVVDTGLRETPLPGVPLAMALSPSAEDLAVIVDEGDESSVLWLDPADGATRRRVPLTGSPDALVWGPDDRLLVGDGANPTLWELSREGAPTAHPLRSPVRDLEVLSSPERARLFVASADGRAVWLYDLATWSPIDINLATSAVDPMWFTSPVRGLGGSSLAWTRPYIDEEEDPVTGLAVAVSLQSGRLVWMQEEDGCLVPDALGPRTSAEQSSAVARDYITSFELSPPYSASLQPTEDPNHNVNINPCAGVAWSEQWQLRYDEPAQVWRATAAISGDQAAPVQEDSRYLSDQAQVSLLVRAGERPSLDNATITFEVLDGVLAVDGEEDGDPDQEVAFDLPGDPVTAIIRIAGEQVPVVLVAATASDIVVRIDPRDGGIDRVWD